MLSGKEQNSETAALHGIGLPLPPGPASLPAQPPSIRLLLSRGPAGEGKCSSEPGLWEGGEGEQGGRKERGRCCVLFFPSVLRTSGVAALRGSQGPAGRGTCARAETIMAQKQSARRTLCFQTGTAGRCRQSRLLFAREHGSASPRCCIPAGRTDGLCLARHLSLRSCEHRHDPHGKWLAAVHPRPPEPGQAQMGCCPVSHWPPAHSCPPRRTGRLTAGALSRQPSPQP